MNNGLVVNFVACWCYFYMWDLLVLPCLMKKRSKNPREVVIPIMNPPVRFGNSLKVSGDLVAGQAKFRSVTGQWSGQGKGWSGQSQRLGKSRFCLSKSIS